MLLIAPTTATGMDQKMIISVRNVLVASFLPILSVFLILRFFQTTSEGVTEIARGFIRGAFLGVIFRYAA
jgi:hypothetical protein